VAPHVLRSTLIGAAVLAFCASVWLVGRSGAGREAVAVAPDVDAWREHALRDGGEPLLAQPPEAAFGGILGHFHLQTDKRDPGPAFDWERLLAAARSRAVAP
jgi:hypothetical protein